MKIKVIHLFSGLLILTGFHLYAREYHVSKTGNDNNPGTTEMPLLTIQAAADLASPGDVITVHAGVYRERITPPRGGTSNEKRIVYRAAEGDKVEIKGSEEIKNWERFKDATWKVTIPNSFFGDYNPYQELVTGDWFLNYGREHHTGEVYLNGKSFYEINSLENVLAPKPLKGAQDQEGSLYQWYCESNSKTTTIWANFHGADPNRELVEINVRPAVFYPKKTGINYITVNGFKMCQAATTWAPPTAEQIGLIGPNWSKGWIIENNTISDSKCSGISLGKDRSTGQNYSSAYKSKNGHICQLEAVFSAIKNGWSKENVGSHIVRNNTISNCEQTGICGNLGAIFSQIYGNHIYDIYTKRQWGGFEMAGIKFHAPVDVLIKDNCIHNAFKGIWIDWQAQGIRITGNLLYNNSWMDLHMEVSHGPHVIDNNCFLSSLNLWNIAVGSAYIHNLFAGQICKGWENERFTPYHYPHSTMVAGIMTTQGGDDRWINNIFIKTPAPPWDIFEKANRPKREEGLMGFGLGIYENYPASLAGTDFAIGEMSQVKLPVTAMNNLYLNGAIPCKNGVNELAINNAEITIRVEEKENVVWLHLTSDGNFPGRGCRVVSGSDLGEAMVPEAVFDNPDGSLLLLNSDYYNESRDSGENKAGPFSNIGTKGNKIKLWPK